MRRVINKLAEHINLNSDVKQESAKLRALRAKNVLTCQRALLLK